MKKFVFNYLSIIIAIILLCIMFIETCRGAEPRYTPYNELPYGAKDDADWMLNNGWELIHGQWVRADKLQAAIDNLVRERDKKSLKLNRADVEPEPHFWIVKPVRTQQGTDPRSDVFAHCATNQFTGGDIGTQTHETTHELNSEMRQATGKECFYCLNNRVVVLSKTKFTKLSYVTARVPQAWHNYDYNVYLIQAQRWWNDEPLYILDEASAYMAGSAARGYTQDDKNHLAEFAVFADALVQTVQFYEPNYVDLAELKLTVEWMKQQTKEHTR